MDKSVAARLGKIVGFRNLLVHRYEVIDDRKMLALMRHDLGYFRTYLNNIASYLSQRGGLNLMTTLDDDLIPGEELRHALPPGHKEAIVQDLTGFMRERPEILFSFLYGSFLEDSSFRDVDVAVYFDQTVPAERRIDICLDLADALSHLAGFPVDVHGLNEASPGFRYHATKGLVLSSNDEKKRCDFLEQTWMTYFDYQPVVRQILVDLLAGLGTSPGKPAADKEQSVDTA